MNVKSSVYDRFATRFRVRNLCGTVLLYSLSLNILISYLYRLIAQYSIGGARWIGVLDLFYVAYCRNEQLTIVIKEFKALCLG